MLSPYFLIQEKIFVEAKTVLFSYCLPVIFELQHLLDLGCWNIDDDNTCSSLCVYLTFIRGLKKIRLACTNQFIIIVKISESESTLKIQSRNTMPKDWHTPRFPQDEAVLFLFKSVADAVLSCKHAFLFSIFSQLAHVASRVMFLQLQ